MSDAKCGTPIRVVVVDDQALVRSGFAMILGAEPDVEVVAEAANGADALRICAQTDPDVVLMDIRMPVLGGVEATRRITAAGSARVLVLTTFDLDEYVYDAVKAGASGFLLKDVRPDDLAHAVRSVAQGDVLIAPAITRRLVEEFVSRPAPGQDDQRLASLTARETEVLTWVGHGLSNAELAQRLVVTETTAKTHVSRVLTKLDLRDRAQAVVMAYETGLVRAGQHRLDRLAPRREGIRNGGQERPR